MQQTPAAGRLLLPVTATDADADSSRADSENDQRGAYAPTVSRRMHKTS